MVFAAIRNVLTLLVLAAVVEAANEVKVNSFTFNGVSLSGSVNLANVAFNKVVNVIYANNAQVWGNTCGATYTSGPDSSNRETWSFNCPISAAGITQFYVEYKVNGQTYYDSNGGVGRNYQVTAPVTPVPTTPTPTGPTPAPTPPGPISPTGFQADVSTFLSTGQPLFKQFLLNNISPKNVPEALPGALIAATPGGVNNYVFHWIRDAGLVMDAVNKLYKGGDNSLEQIFWDHATFNKRLQQQSTLTGFGEAKYFVDGRAFNEPWCRPQNDGPALRASSFMRFARTYLDKGGSLQRVRDLWNSTSAGVIKNDIEYVTRNYNDANNCDLWEEIRGEHFFTVAVQRRAMHEARDFANFLGDTGAGAFYAQQATLLDNNIARFWNAGAQSVQSSLNSRLLDAAIGLGAVHGNNGDGFFAPEDDRILSSMYSLGAGFINEYTLNRRVLTDAEGRMLSVAIGRYYGDKYDGAANTLGNPWFLCTAIVAETAYRAATAFVKAGRVTVTNNNRRLFNGPKPAGLGLNVATGTFASDTAQFKEIIRGLQTYGDIHIRRIRFHGASGFRFNEQYNRDTGLSQGVDNLTWSYGSLLTANNAREELAALTGTA